MLQQDFSGIGLRQLISTERDLIDQRYVSSSGKPGNLRSQQQKYRRDKLVEGKKVTLSELGGADDNLEGNGPGQAGPNRKNGPQVDLKAAASFGDEEQFKTERAHPHANPIMGHRKLSSPAMREKPYTTQGDQINKRRLFSSQGAQSHAFLEPLSTKAASRFAQNPLAAQSANKVFRINKKYQQQQGRGSQQFLAKMHQQHSVQGSLRKKLEPAQSQKTLRKASTKPSYQERVLSKLTIFKKKIEIDDEQNRLGPNNKVNLQKHKDLYFNTNPNDLKLRGSLVFNRLGQDALASTLGRRGRQGSPSESDDTSSDSSFGNHSLRSKIARNEQAMRAPSPEIARRTSKLKSINAAIGGASNPNLDAEKLMRQKSMAPVKDWTSTVTRRVQNSKYGVETTKKHYEREAVAKYIYNKFGVHLLTFNHQTRNEVIPMFGEHIRQTNSQVFDDDKNALLNRKNSAMRSHFIGLKRDLKKQNLPIPQAVKGAEQDKFIRKRIIEEQDELMRSPGPMGRSPEGSPSPRQTAAARLSSAPGAFSARHGAPSLMQPMSHRSQGRFYEDLEDFDDESDLNFCAKKTARPVIDDNMDNLEWQKTALNKRILYDLYEAKCIDLRIENDRKQRVKFCAHIISKAKNRCLNLSNCYFKESSAWVLANQFMLFNQRVSSYDLSFNELGDNGVLEIALALKRTKHIVHLNLDMNNIQWEGVQHLSRALCVNESLIDLSLSSGKSGGNNRNRVMERGAYELREALSVNKFLLFLNLTGNAIGNEGLSYLLPAIAASNTLIQLNLTSNEITSGPIRQMILKDKQRNREYIEPAYLHEREWTSLAPFSPNLAYGSTDNNAQGKEHALKEKKRQKLQTAFLIKEFLVKQTSLKELILKSNKIGDEGMQVIASALSLRDCKVQLLNLTQTHISAESFRSIVMNMRTNHEINTLIVDRNNLATTYVFSQISMIIAASSSLKVFSAAQCHLMDTFGVQFAEALKTNKGLTKFNLQGNELTSRTLSTIAGALKETQGNLEEMNLAKNNFDDKGGIKLGESLRYNDTVTKVNLSDNNLTDETALAINRNLMERRVVDEVILSKNLINLRVIELITQTCLKIKEIKTAAQLPNQLRQKQQFKHNRSEAIEAEEQREKNVGILEWYEFTTGQLRREKEKIVQKAEGVMDELQRKLDLLKKQLKATDEVELETARRVQEENIEFDMQQRNKEGNLNKLVYANEELSRELERTTDRLKMLKSENQTTWDIEDKKLRFQLAEIEMGKKKHQRANNELANFKNRRNTLSRSSGTDHTDIASRRRTMPRRPTMERSGGNLRNSQYGGVTSSDGGAPSTNNLGSKQGSPGKQEAHIIPLFRSSNNSAAGDGGEYQFGESRQSIRAKRVGENQTTAAAAAGSQAGGARRTAQKLPSGTTVGNKSDNAAATSAKRASPNLRKAAQGSAKRRAGPSGKNSSMKVV